MNAIGYPVADPTTVPTRPMTEFDSDSCDLCGLSLRHGVVDHIVGGRPYRFCCLGCKQVFTMLMAASDAADPAEFKNSELFIQCRQMGIIPGSEADLIAKEPPRAVFEPPGRDDRLLETTFRVTGMWCPACAWVIDETLRKLPGIAQARCNFSTDRLACRYDPLTSAPDRIREAVEKLGYQAVDPGEVLDRSERHREMLRFGVSAVLTMNIMMLSFVLYTGFFDTLSREAIAKISWPIFLMATVVLVYGGRTIFRRAWAGFFQAAASMEALIAAGSASAYLFSCYNLLRGSIHLYFDTAAMLITLVLLGKLLERGAKDRVQETLENLFSLQPTKVNLCTPAFPQGRYVAVEQLQNGDVFRVASDEVVPADGVITAGSGTVDESSLTGEALPVRRRPGDVIRSGATVIEGDFSVRARAVGAESILGQMIAIIEASLNKKTRFEGRTDRLLQWFVPLILLLAAATGLGCYWLGGRLETAIVRAVTVMVISCPCALGVAIPLARTAAFSAASRIGLLIRDFESFERVETIDTFVFDKTGTITQGQWRLQAVIPAETVRADDAVAVAAGLEVDCDHYIAQAIKQYARRKGIVPAPVTQIQPHDNGISGRWAGNEVKIGSTDFVARTPVSDQVSGMPTGPGTDRMDTSKVYLDIGGRPAAVFAFGDELRASAVATLQTLRQQGYRLFMVSGDGDAVTRHVGVLAGVDDARGNQTPQQKAALIDEWRLGQHHRIAMVGDGINDAPALSAADLAVAVYAGSHLGKEVADITLMRGQPAQILDFLELARQTNRKVHQNLACAFIYNLVSIPIAMSGLLTPLVAVFAMLLSSLSVTGNSLLLVRKYRRTTVQIAQTC